MIRHSLGAVALAAMLGLPLAASAQTPLPGAVPPGPPAAGAPHRHRHGDPFLRGLRQLQLSDAQKQQIFGYIRSSHEALRRQIDGVLTPDQRAQLRANLGRERRFPEQTGGQRPERQTQ